MAEAEALELLSDETQLNRLEETRLLHFSPYSTASNQRNGRPVRVVPSACANVCDTACVRPTKGDNLACVLMARLAQLLQAGFPIAAQRGPESEGTR